MADSGEGGLNTQLLDDFGKKLDQIYLKLGELDERLQKFENREVKIELSRNTRQTARALDELARAFERFRLATSIEVRSATDSLVRFVTSVQSAISKINNKQFEKFADAFAIFVRSLDRSSVVLDTIDSAAFDTFGKVFKRFITNVADTIPLFKPASVDKFSKSLRQLFAAIDRSITVINTLDVAAMVTFSTEFDDLLTRLNVSLGILDISKVEAFSKTFRKFFGAIDKSTEILGKINFTVFTTFKTEFEALMKGIKDIEIPDNVLKDANFSSFVKNINQLVKTFEMLDKSFRSFGSLNRSSGLFIRIIKDVGEAFKALAELGTSSEARNLGNFISSVGEITRVFAVLERSFTQFGSLRRSSALFLRIIDTLKIAFDRLATVFRSVDSAAVGAIAELAGRLVSVVRVLIDLEQSFQKLTSFIRAAGLFERAITILVRAIQQLVRATRGIDSNSIKGVSDILQQITQLGKDDPADLTALRSYIEFVEDLGRTLSRIRIDKNTVSSLDSLFKTIKEVKSGDNENIKGLFGVDIAEFEDRVRQGAKTAISEVLRVSAVTGILVAALRQVASVFLHSFPVGFGLFDNSIDNAIEKAKELTDVFYDIGENIRDAGQQIIESFGIQNIFNSDAFSSAVEFDRLSTQVQVFGDLTNAALLEAQAFANQIGIDYPLSANDALAATLDLIKAGQSLEEIEFILPSAADLAALSDSGDLNAATQTLIAAAAGFETFSDASGVALGGFENIAVASNVISGAADISTASVESLSAGLANVGPAANAFGLSLEETAAILAIFDQNAIRGAEGGTALRALLNAFGSDNSIAALERLGVSLFADDGGRRPLNDVINEIGAAINDLPDAQRAAVLQQLADTYGRQGLQVLLNSGTDAINNTVDAINGVAPASERAALLLDNFAGDVEQLKGSMETLLVRALLPTLDRFFRPFIKIARFVVDGFLNLSDSAFAFISSMVVIASLGATLIGGFAVFAGAVLQVGSVFLSVVTILISFQTVVISIASGLVVFTAGLLAIVAAAAVVLPLIFAISAVFETLFKIFTEDIAGAATSVRVFFASFQPIFYEVGRTLTVIGVALQAIFGISQGGEATLQGIGSLIRDFFLNLTHAVRGPGVQEALQFLRDFQRFLFITTGLLSARYGDQFSIAAPITDFFDRLQDGEGLQESFEHLQNDLIAQMRILGIVLLEAARRVFGPEAVNEFIGNFISDATGAASGTFVEIIRDRIIAGILANRDVVRDTVVSIFRFLFSPLRVAKLLANILGINLVTDFINGIENFLATALGQVLDLIFNLLEGQSISNAFINAFGPAIEPVVRFAEILYSTVQTIIQIIQNLIAILFSPEFSIDVERTFFAFLEGLTNFMDRLNREVLQPFADGDFLRGLGNLAKIIIEAIDNFVRSLLNIDSDDSIGNAVAGLLVRIIQAILQAIREAFATLSEVTGINFNEIADSIITAFEEFVDQFRTARGRRRFFRKAQEMIEAILEAIQDGIDFIIEQLEQYIDFDAVGETIVDAFVAFTELFTTEAGRAKLRDAGQAVVDAIQAVIEFIIELIHEATGFDLGELFSPNASTEIVEQFTHFTENLGTGIQNAFSNIGDFVSNIQLPDMPTFVTDFLTSFTVGMENAIQTQPAESLFTGVVNALLGLLGTAITAGFALLTTITGIDFSTIANSITTLLDTTISANLAAGSSLTGTFAVTANTIIGLLAAAITGAFTGLGALIGIDTTVIATELDEAFGGLFDAFNQLFTDTEEGDSVFTNIQQIIENLIDAFSSLLAVFAGGGGGSEGTNTLLQTIGDFLARLIGFGVDTIADILNTIDEFFEFLSELDDTQLAVLAIAVTAFGAGILSTLVPALLALGIALLPLLATGAAIGGAILLVTSAFAEFDEITDILDEFLALDLGGVLAETIDAVIAIFTDMAATLAELLGFDAAAERIRTFGADLRRQLSVMAQVVADAFAQIGRAITRTFTDAADSINITLADIASGVNQISPDEATRVAAQSFRTLNAAFAAESGDLDIATLFSDSIAGTQAQDDLDSFARLRAGRFISSFTEELATAAQDGGGFQVFTGANGEAFRNALETTLSAGLGPEFFAGLFKTGDQSLISAALINAIGFGPDAAAQVFETLQNQFNAGTISGEQLQLTISSILPAVTDAATREALLSLLDQITNAVPPTTEVPITATPVITIPEGSFDGFSNLGIEAEVPVTTGPVDIPQVQATLDELSASGQITLAVPVEPAAAAEPPETTDLGLGGVNPENAATLNQDIVNLRTNLALLLFDIQTITPAFGDLVAGLQDVDEQLITTDASIVQLHTSATAAITTMTSGFLAIALAATTALILVVLPTLSLLIARLNPGLVTAVRAATTAMIEFGSKSASTFNSIASGAGGAINSVNSLAKAINSANKVAQSLAANVAAANAGAGGGGQNPVQGNAAGGSVRRDEITRIDEGGSEVWIENGKMYLLARAPGRVATLKQALPELSNAAQTQAAPRVAPSNNMVNNTSNISVNVEGSTVSIALNGTNLTADDVIKQVVPQVETMLKNRDRQVKDILRTNGR